VIPTSSKVTKNNIHNISNVAKEIIDAYKVKCNSTATVPEHLLHNINGLLFFLQQANGDVVFAKSVRISVGIWIILHNIDNSAAGDTKFINLLLQTIFGNEILSKSSITGFSKHDKNIRSEKLDHMPMIGSKGLPTEVDSLTKLYVHYNILFGNSTEMDVVNELATL
jgi:hypothetical protein